MLEISDVIVDYDPDSLARRPVSTADALRRLASQPAAARLVERLPATDGVLDPEAMDALLVRSHGEMQRLWEEFLHGARVRALLGGMVRLQDGPVRVVDVGCGTGYVVRWLAAHRVFDDAVTLVGVDYNAALIERARRLAAVEGLRCEFRVANAFRLDEPATIYLSTGVLHHFRGASLDRFFEEQARTAPLGFVHFDIQPSRLAPVGAWLFHRARMREPVARHDGTVSAIRAHPASRLFEAARCSGPAYAVSHYNRRIWWLPMLRTMHAVVGVRAGLCEGYRAALERERLCLGPFE